MDDAQNVVAFDDAVHNDAHRIDVVDFIETSAVHIHLAVDAIDAFDAALQVDFLAVLHHDPLDDALLNVVDKLVALVAFELEHVLDLLVSDRVEVAQGQILQLLLDRPDTEPVRQGGIDLHRLQRLIALFLGAHHREGSHIVQPVGQLDDDDAHILCHRQQHLAHILRLLLLPRGKRDFTELGHAVDQQGDILAKLFFDDVERRGGILHHVVQQRRYDGIGIHPELHQDFRHVNGVHHIRFTRDALLSLMRGKGRLIGARDGVHVILFSRVFYGGKQPLKYLCLRFIPIAHLFSPNLIKLSVKGSAKSWIGSSLPCRPLRTA